MKKTYHKHAGKADHYYDRFLTYCGDGGGGKNPAGSAGADRPFVGANEVIIFQLAKEIDFPPSMLAKMIVERHLWWQKVSLPWDVHGRVGILED